MPAISMMRYPASGPIVVSLSLAACLRRRRCVACAVSVSQCACACIGPKASTKTSVSQACPTSDPAGPAECWLASIARAGRRLAARRGRSAGVRQPRPRRRVRALRARRRVARARLEELKDIQWQIRENEARYRDLLDNQADVILRRDADGRLTFVNQAFCRVFGLERAAVLGQPFRPAVFAGERPRRCAPAPRSAAALRAGDRDGRRAALVRVGGACRGGRRRCRAGGAVAGPRHHRGAPGRGRADRRAPAGGSGQPGQVALPRGHEPRDPHAHERHPRHDLAAGRHRAVAGAADLRPGHRAVGAHAARR